MTPGDDSFDDSIAQEAFFRYRRGVHPDWTDDDPCWSLRRVHAEIAELIQGRPDVLGELRVALLIAGLLDEGWQQMHSRQQGHTEAELLDVDLDNELGLPHAIARALEAGVVWMLDELLKPERPSEKDVDRGRDAPSGTCLASGPFFAFRYPLHHADLEHDIPEALLEVGFETPTMRLVAAALWSAMLRDMMDRRRHPSERVLVAFELAFPDHQALPGLAHYRACRFHPNHSAPHRRGRPPLRRVDHAEKEREERSIALEVNSRWESNKRSGKRAPQRTALREVAERRHIHLVNVRTAWSRHRPFVTLCDELADHDFAPEFPSPLHDLAREFLAHLRPDASE